MLLWTLTAISGEPHDPAIGFYQEFNAEESMAALKKMTVPRAKVRRDGAITSIPASEIVHAVHRLLAAAGLGGYPTAVLEGVKIVRRARR